MMKQTPRKGAKTLKRVWKKMIQVSEEKIDARDGKSRSELKLTVMARENS